MNRICISSSNCAIFMQLETISEYLIFYSFHVMQIMHAKIMNKKNLLQFGRATKKGFHGIVGNTSKICSLFAHTFTLIYITLIPTHRQFMWDVCMRNGDISIVIVIGTRCKLFLCSLFLYSSSTFHFLHCATSLIYSSLHLQAHVVKVPLIQHYYLSANTRSGYW